MTPPTPDSPAPPYLIWWTSGLDCGAIDDATASHLPDYIRYELRSRTGRAGRGRLWVPIDYVDIESIPWADKKVANLIDAGSMGGIVIHPDDFYFVAGLPGFVTDPALDFYFLEIATP